MCYTDAYTASASSASWRRKVPNNYASLADDPHHGARGQHPQRQASRAGRGALDDRPHAARRDVRLPDQALPHGVPAEGTSCLWNLRLMGGLGRAELIARADEDGDAATT